MKAVSIAILTYKRHQHLMRALRSACVCASHVEEIIVVDNAAEPELKRLIESEFPAVRYLAAPSNGGCEGRNIALRAARTQILITIDDDVELISADCIGEVERAFARDSSLACLNFTVLGSDGQVLERDWCHPRPISHASREFETHFILEGASALSRDKVLRVGGYPAAFFLGHEGVDLGYRLIRDGSRLMHTPRIAVTHYVASEERPGWRLYYYNTRNGIWVGYRSFPTSTALRQSLRYVVMMGLFALRAKQLGAFLRGCTAAIRGLPGMERNCLDHDSLEYVRAIRAQRVPLVGRIHRHLRERIM